MNLSELQAAFIDLSAAITRMQRRAEHGLILSVFKDNDPRIDSAEWCIDAGDVPVISMSDGLYALYCASEGIENTNRRSKTA